MDKKHLVSIIMPVHNTAAYLTKCLDSISAQTYANIEVCAAFDNCSDASVEIFKSHPVSAKSNWVECDKRQPAATRNLAIGLAKGDYIAYLDSDDWWEPQKLERCMAVMLEQQHDLVWHDEFYFFEESNKSKIHTYRPLNNYYPDLLWKGNCISTSAVVHRSLRERKSFQQNLFDESPKYRGVEDYRLWIALAKDGYRFGHIPECLGHYRIRENSLARNKARMYENALHVIDKEIHDLYERGRLSDYLKAQPFRLRLRMLSVLGRYTSW
jgi:glycosyltransferase involved in cell wall biosynthesis